MIEAALLLAGAIAGVAADRVWDLIKDAYQQRRVARSAANRRQSMIDSRASIVSYFRAQGADQALYKPRTFASDPLPMLINGADRLTGPVEATREYLIVVEDGARVALPVDQRIIRQRQREGADLWDGELLFVTGAERADGSPVRVRAGVCNYYSYVTSSAELVRDVHRARWAALDKYQQLDQLLEGVVRPVVIASATTCVFYTADGAPEVAIQRRSSAVVNGANDLGVIPVFGFESNVRGRQKSKYGVVLYNFVKEFVEEFYGLEVLTKAAGAARLAPDWIFETDQARAVLDEFNAGRLALTVTRVGADLTDGSLTVAMLAVFSSADFFERLKLEATASWESQEVAPGDRPIEFLPLHGEEMNTMSARMYPSSLFSLDLARSALSTNGAA